MSIREYQQFLKDHGYDPGPIDGKDGPKTRAAVKRWQADHGLVADGIVGPKTQASFTSGGGATPAASTPDAKADATIQAQNPSWGWLLNDPEVGPLLRKGLPADQLELAIKQTNWYRSRTDAERAYLQMAALNPKEAERQLNNYDVIQSYRTDAAKMGIQVGFEAAARQVDRVVRGEIAPDALRQELRNQAKALYPYLSQQIDQGLTVDDVWEPIKNVAANTLGINPANVSLFDTKWSSLLQMPDGKGGFRLPSQAEIERQIRNDPVYGFTSTQNGRDSAFGMLQALNEGFGFTNG